MVKINIFNDPIFPGTEFHDQLGGYDSNLWLELFVRADKINPDLAQRLMYLRNVGCRLHESAKFGFIIVPEVCEQEKMDRSTYFRDIKEINKKLSGFIFGIDGLSVMRQR